MRIADVRAKTDEELKKEVLSLYKEEMNLRFEKANGQLKDTAKIRRVRRDIARVQTVITEHKLGLVVVSDKAKSSKKKVEAPKAKTVAKKTETKTKTTKKKKVEGK